MHKGLVGATEFLVCIYILVVSSLDLQTKLQHDCPKISEPNFKIIP